MTLKVSFFIIGAPKCGTTALSTYLGEHPGVRFCNPKEPYYFSPELNCTGQRIAASLEDYHFLFGSNYGELCVGEGSVSYFLSETAVSRIQKYNPSAKFIVMLREPAQMLYSWHNQLVTNLLEWEPSFEAAWKAQAAREKGEGLKIRPNVSPEIFKWKQWVSYGTLLERLYEAVPAEQCKVVLYDDFKERISEIYREVLAFLGLPDDGLFDFPVVNKSRQVRAGTRGMIHLNNRVTPAFRKAVKQVIGTLFRLDMDGRFDRFTRPERERASLDQDLRREINESVRPEIEKASSLLQRDLSHWLR